MGFSLNRIWTNKCYLIGVLAFIMIVGIPIFILTQSTSFSKGEPVYSRREPKSMLMVNDYICKKYNNLHRYFFSDFALDAFDDKSYEENYLIPKIKGTTWFDFPIDRGAEIFNKIELESLPKANIKVQELERKNILKEIQASSNHTYVDKSSFSQNGETEEENNINYDLLHKLQKNIKIARERK